MFPPLLCARLFLLAFYCHGLHSIAAPSIVSPLIAYSHYTHWLVPATACYLELTQILPASTLVCRVSKKVAAKKAAQRMAASGVLVRPTYDGGIGDSSPFPPGMNARVTYPTLVGGAMEQQWKGLARGGTAGGVAFVSGRPTLRPNFSGGLQMAPPPDFISALCEHWALPCLFLTILEMQAGGLGWANI